MKQPYTFDQIYSMRSPIKSAEYLFENTTGKTEWALMEEEGEEKESSRLTVRGGVLDGTRSGVGQKWPLEKLNI